jgi:starvation-inducible DNA-binding protein
MNEDLIKASKIAFASTYSFVIKAQNFHWNVEGMFFEPLHNLFGKIYEEVYNSIDTFAEEIRAMDAYTPASFQSLSMLSQVNDENEILDSKQMVMELLSDNDKMIKMLQFLFELSEANKQFGFSDFVAGRLDAHKKHGWMLKATLR